MVASLAIHSVARGNVPPLPQGRGADASEQAQGASDGGDDRWDRVVALWGHASPAGPFGVLGVGIDVAPSRYLAIEAGTGIDFDGPQLGIWPRLRLPLSRGFAVSAGPSLAVGRYDADDDCFACVDRQYEGPYRYWDPAIVGGMLGAVEGRTESGFSWRVYLGVAHVLNESDVECTQPDPETGCAGGLTEYVYLGGAFGYAFD